MRHLLRIRVSGWRFAAALMLTIILSGVVPYAALAQEEQEQPTAVGVGGPPDGPKPPRGKCKGSSELSQPDTQCGW